VVAHTLIIYGTVYAVTSIRPGQIAGHSPNIPGDATVTKTKVRSIRFGLFQTREAADRAIADLKAAGYKNDQIGLLYKNAGGSTTKLDGAGVPDTKAPEGAAVGAAAGAIGGAAVGAGIMAGVIPVIGPVLALGTLGTILVNAAGGAALVGVADRVAVGVVHGSGAVVSTAGRRSTADHGQDHASQPHSHPLNGTSLPDAVLVR
jgi:hypothetical protein